jgi:hypothetical protein
MLLQERKMQLLTNRRQNSKTIKKIQKQNLLKAQSHQVHKFTS